MAGWGFDDIPDQSGRTAIVTGANAGIGFETARALLKKGARVVLACRDLQKGRTAVARLAAEGAAERADVRRLDLADLDSVREFADGFAAAYPRLDLLINNAGVMVPPFGRTTQGFELQFGTNHLGHFALTGRLLPVLRATAGSRVVVVYSGVYRIGRIDFDDPNYERRRYVPWLAYSQSKLATLLFALELGRRAGASDPIVTAAHPGWTATDLQRTAGIVRFFNPYLAMDAAHGALPTLRAATDPRAATGSHWGPSRFFEMNGPPEPAHLAVVGRDAATAARLWNLSEELTGLRYDFHTARAV